MINFMELLLADGSTDERDDVHVAVPDRYQVAIRP